MGVYIKGMEMPTSCGVCPFCVPEADEDNGDICVLCGQFPLIKQERSIECPLVSIPPHGDLIDRKTAYDSLLDGMVMTGYQSRALDCINDFYVPTIIEAEGGET